MKNSHRILLLLLTLLHITTCLRVHQTISSVTFVTPNSNTTNTNTTSAIDYKYYDNLQSPSANYYYGSITKDAYDMHIKQYQLQNYQNCFGQLPYATSDAQSCMKCPNEKPLFNLGTRQCQICRLNISQKCNTILSQQAASANTQPTQVNSSSSSISSNTTNKNPVVSSNSTLTNNSTANNSQAVINNSNQTVNSSQKNTTSTATGQNVTKNSGNQSYPYVFEWQPKQTNSTSSTITTANTSKNTSNNSLQNVEYIPAVPLGQNSTNNNYPNYTVINGPQNTTNNTNNQTVLIADNSQPQIKFASSQCPYATPFYNSTTKKCEACASGTQYISAQKKCLNFIYATDPRSKLIILNSSDQIINKNYQIQTKNPTRTIKYCPSNMPYQINGTCNQCINGSLYNATSQKCQNGCPEGQVYNQITSNCVNGTYITNPSASTLLSPLGNYDTFKKQQQTLLSSSFIYVKCPLNNPISINNKCTQCDSATPYYNIDSKKCEVCSRGRYYDESTKNCKGDYDQGLQIYRMVPNIV